MSCDQGCKQGFWRVVGGRESGRGLPHSKTWRNEDTFRSRDSVLECGSPLPLFLFSGRAKDLPPETLVGGGQIHRFMEDCDVSLEGNAAGL